MAHHDTVIIGAGLTGLSTAFHLKKHGIDAVVLEKENRIGGQIRTFTEDGFTFESGPNTGVVSFPEVAELFQQLDGKCELEIARESSKRRLIWKGSRFHALPSGLVSAVRTPLFTLCDKFRILGEPWRKRGTDPNESVGALACRRLGKSFYEYAVDPFVSGVYAGDPMKLTTRYALPKLYRLEAEHGSFIRGSIAKAREPKTERDRLVTKKVFSAVGGLQRMVEAMGKDLRIVTDAKDIKVMPVGERYRLLSWAAESPKRYIVEDDYDSEFRMTGKPIPALQNIDVTEKVVYLNTFSKTMTSAIRLSYMVLPPHLAEKFHNELSFYSCTVSTLDQYVMAKFIDLGYYEMHINRMRNLYRSKRDALLTAIDKSKLSKVAHVYEEDAGLHFILEVNANYSDAEFCKRLRQKGINVRALSEYYFVATPSEHKFVINYSSVERNKMKKAVQIIADLFSL